MRSPRNADLQMGWACNLVRYPTRQSLGSESIGLSQEPLVMDPARFEQYQLLCEEIVRISTNK